MAAAGFQHQSLGLHFVRSNFFEVGMKGSPATNAYKPASFGSCGNFSAKLKENFLQFTAHCPSRPSRAAGSRNNLPPAREYCTENVERKKFVATGQPICFRKPTGKGSPRPARGFKKIGKIRTSVIASLQKIIIMPRIKSR